MSSSLRTNKYTQRQLSTLAREQIDCLLKNRVPIMMSSYVSRRRLLQLAAAGTVTGLAGCTSNQSGTDGGRTSTEDDPSGKTVAVGPSGRYVFTPGTENPLRISPGTAVKFVWESDTHNIYVDSQPEGADWQGHESIENTGFTYQHTFDVEGTYHYWCEPHKSVGMVADIIVE